MAQKVQRRARASPANRGREKKNMNRWLLWLPLSVCLAACGSSAGSGTPSAPSPTPATYRLGEAATVAGWLVTMKSLKLTLQNGSAVPKHPDDMLLVLEVTVLNTSSKSATASDSSFHCRGATGTTYDRVSAGNPSIDGAVKEGSAVSGQIAFEVPIGTHQFNVFYEDTDGSILATWHLTVSPTQ